MKRSEIARWAMLVLLLGFGSSCAVAPATMRRIGIGSQADQPWRGGSSGELLRLALDGEDTEVAAGALAAFVEKWKDDRGGEIEGDVKLNGGVAYHVRFVGGAHGSYPLSYFDEISSASDFELKGIEHHRRSGVGAPLMALRENQQREPIEVFYPPEAITRPLTAVISGRSVVGEVTHVDIEMLCPLQVDSVTTPEGSQTLAADFSVPWAAILSRSRGLSRLRLLDSFRPKPKRDPQLYLMEPYDPNKEPLLLIHGLFDTPLVWAQLSNELWRDDSIRQRYQIWHYLYNTSAPALYSGRILRTKLREVRKLLDPELDDPAMQSTTVIAHSMGGIVTRSLLTRPGDTFWDAAFTRPIESLELSDEDRASLQEAFFWEAESHVKRVIFLAVPHRGSEDTHSRRGRLAQFLVRPPNSFAKFYGRISGSNPGAFTPEYEALGSGKLDSVHALSPRQPTLKILSSLPNDHPVATHSIIGDRGLDGPLEKSSDGTVEYWSSHLEDAVSEKIVPSDHQIVDHPETLSEIRRILELPRGR